jgi:hypothetical protein
MKYSVRHFIDFDKQVHWHYYEDKIAVAKNLGYKAVTQAFYDLYITQNKSLTHIKEVFGYMSIGGITAVFRKFKWPLKQHGGARDFNHLYPHVHELREKYDAIPNITRAVRTAFIKEHSVRLGVSVHAVRNVVDRKTWKNIEAVIDNESDIPNNMCKSKKYWEICGIDASLEERAKYHIGSIFQNKAKCLSCGDIVVSENRHDCGCCSCGSLCVDGGSWGIRRVVKDESCLYEELSEYYTVQKVFYEE